MGNRKQEIENLESEINQKQQTLRELKNAESKLEQANVSEEQIKKVVDEF